MTSIVCCILFKYLRVSKYKPAWFLLSLAAFISSALLGVTLTFLMDLLYGIALSFATSMTSEQIGSVYDNFYIDTLKDYPILNNAYFFYGLFFHNVLVRAVFNYLYQSIHTV